jgi:Flp pilus assembly protein TadB
LWRKGNELVSLVTVFAFLGGAHGTSHGPEILLYVIWGVPIYAHDVLLSVLALGIALYPLVVWNNRRKKRRDRKNKNSN